MPVKRDPPSLLLSLMALGATVFLVFDSGQWATSQPSENPQLLYHQGLQKFNAEQLPAAIELWQRALQGYRHSNNRKGIGDTLYQLGFAYYWIEQYELAIAAYQESLTLAEALGDQQRQATLWGYLGDVYFYQKNYSQAIKACQRSLPLAEASQDQTRQWFSTYRLGEAYYALKEYRSALVYYQHSLDLAKTLGDRQLERIALSGMGQTYVRLEWYRPAFEALQRELSLSQGLGDPKPMADSLQLLGFVAYWLNDYRQAIQYYEQSLDLARPTQQSKTEQLALSGLGDTYFFVGDYDQALAYHQASLQIATTLNNPDVLATLYNALGGDYYMLDQPDQAIAYYEKSLTLTKSLATQGNNYANSLSGLGQVYFEQKHYSQALSLFQESRAVYRRLGNHYNEGAVLSNLGHVYLQLKQYDSAIQAFQKRLALSESMQERYGQAQALGELGLALILKKDYVPAEKHLRASLAISEAIREKLGNQDQLKVSFFDTQTSIYRLLQLVLVAQNQPEAALEIAERGRARAFADLLAQQIHSPSFRSTLTAPNLAQIRQTVQREQATVVQYSLINEANKLYIWVIPPQGPIQFRQIDLEGLPQPDLRDTVNRARRAVHRLQAPSPNPAPVAGNPLRQLEQLLIEPIADFLPTDPRQAVIFIPQGELFSVPFAALTNAQGQALVERYTIRTMPSLQALALGQDLAQQRHRQSPAQLALVVGNPQLAPALQQPPYNLVPLPHAEAEAQAIAPLLGTRPLLGSEATPTTLTSLVTQARIIHLATHGLLDNFRQGGLPGAIALAPEGDHNGLWTANDIVKLLLKADLVVLSACNTGQGKITGDGVLGLSRAWLTAGARSLVVSLWSVPDEPTALLMTQFYQNLARGQDSALALRQAMLTVKQQYPEPVNWAGFILMGESFPLAIP
ncbi:CHAT domain-containing tetratricopeptide repeat protein [Synechocystis sp. LKSZ1]|uniref:CHAT domain-containing tetratricopeptide repeat protein n=1 Tax=Synechocystis sp. LKSZ1 TaxID=3144951 RepID=UPI00336BCEAB